MEIDKAIDKIQGIAQRNPGVVARLMEEWLGPEVPATPAEEAVLDDELEEGAVIGEDVEAEVEEPVLTS